MKHEGDQQARCLKIKSWFIQKLIYRTSVHMYNVTGLNVQVIYISLSTFLQIPWMAEDFKRWKRKDWSYFWRGWRILVGL